MSEADTIREALHRFEHGSGDNNCMAAFKALFALERRAEQWEERWHITDSSYQLAMRRAEQAECERDECQAREARWVQEHRATITPGGPTDEDWYEAWERHDMRERNATGEPE